MNKISVVDSAESLFKALLKISLIERKSKGTEIQIA